MKGERSYYLEDFSDEIMPCNPDLHAWAEWLSKPDAEWSRDQAAQDGARFKAGVIVWDDDIVATHGPDGWSFSREVGDATFLAVRWADGSGWDPDNILWGDDMGAALREFFAAPDHAVDLEERELVAVGRDEIAVMLTYRTNPPRLEVETVQ